MPDSRSSLLDETEDAFSATHWTLHYESVMKCTKQCKIILQKLCQSHISNEHLLDNLAFDEKSNNLMRNVF